MSTHLRSRRHTSWLSYQLHPRRRRSWLRRLTNRGWGA